MAGGEPRLFSELGAAWRTNRGCAGRTGVPKRDKLCHLHLAFLTCQAAGLLSTEAVRGHRGKPALAKGAQAQYRMPRVLPDAGNIDIFHLVSDFSLKNSWFWEKKK